MAEEAKKEEFDEILLRIPTRLLKQVDKLAEDERRSRTSQLNILIERGLEQ